MKIGCIRLNVFFVHSDKNNCNMKSMNKNVDIKFSPLVSKYKSSKCGTSNFL
jgi:hypothetical protein